MSLLGAKIGIKVLSKIVKEIMENREMKRLRKYVNEDNELDIQVKVLQKNYAKLCKEIEEMQNEFAILRRD